MAETTYSLRVEGGASRKSGATLTSNRNQHRSPRRAVGATLTNWVRPFKPIITCVRKSHRSVDALRKVRRGGFGPQFPGRFHALSVDQSDLLVRGVLHDFRRVR